MDNTHSVFRIPTIRVLLICAGWHIDCAIRCYEADKMVKQKSFIEGGKIWKKGGEFIMKARVMTLPLLLLTGFLISSCATLDRLNTEYEEQTTRVEKMTPQERADWDQEQHEEFMIDMKGYFGDGD